MKRRILSIITAPALRLSLCPTWALAAEGEPDTGLCTHGETAEDCPLCPIEDLTAALPEQVTEDNAANAPAPAVDGVVYLDADGKTQTQNGCTEVVASNAAVTWSDGWYVVASNVTITERLTVNGHVNLILANNCTLDAQAGITVRAASSVTIYAQSDGEGMGTLKAKANSYSYAGIGGAFPSDFDSGSITINGGNITATGSGAAGIGNSKDSRNGTITISDNATVKATGGEGADAVGNGSGNSSGSTVKIEGGTVTAIPGEADSSGTTGSSFPANVTISGGDIMTIPEGGGAPVEVVAVVSWEDGAEWFTSIEYAWDAACRGKPAGTGGGTSTPTPATISLLQDVETSQSLHIDEYASNNSDSIGITLNGSGHSITGTCNVMNLSVGKVTINNCKIKSTAEDVPAVLVNGTDDNHAALIINSGEIIGGQDGLMISRPGKVTLNGGTFTAVRDAIFSRDDSFDQMLGTGSNRERYAFRDGTRLVDLSGTIDVSEGYALLQRLRQTQ